MSHCPHCDAFQIHMDTEPDKGFAYEGFAYCLESLLIIVENDTHFISKIYKIPFQIINSDSDTPEWCPRGLK